MLLSFRIHATIRPDFKSDAPSSGIADPAELADPAEKFHKAEKILHRNSDEGFLICN